MKKTSIFIFFFSIVLVSCLFEESPYITESNDTEKLDEKIKQKNKLALILLYSPYCPHCHKFAPQYENLSKEFKDYADFYSINVMNNNNYRKKFPIYGVPTLFIYYNGEYKQHKGGNSYDIVYNVLKKNYINLECEEIDYKKFLEFKNSYQNSNNINNYVIGFFDNNEIKDNYIKITVEYLKFIDKCYYCLNNQNNEENNIIITENKQRGKNYFNEYKSGIINNTINNNYISFIMNKVRNIFIDIYEQSKMYLLEYQDRDILIFSYKSESEKQDFLTKINELDELSSKYKNRLFNFILLKFDNVYSAKYKLNEYGIYISNNKLNNIQKIENITEIGNMIKGKNDDDQEIQSENNINTNNINNNTNTNTNNISPNVVDQYLQKFIDKKKEKDILIRNKIIISISCFFGYVLVFYWIYKIYVKQKKENMKKNINQGEKLETV